MDNCGYSINYNVVLGEGSFSKVYLGRNSTGLPVAIKRIDMNFIKDSVKSVIEEEQRIMQFIKENPNENIVQCFDIICKNMILCFMLEYMEDGTLRDIMIKPIKEKFVRYYFIQIAQGLHYLCKNNIVHRDIKPKNILLTCNKRKLKICDFGLAKKKEGDNNDGDMYKTVCGSPLYMAPEILKKENYNRQSDLWSLGIIMYEMLFGIHPFQQCRTVMELREMIDEDIIMPKSGLIISPDGIEILETLLQNNSNKRITWDEFFDHKWLKGRFIIEEKAEEVVEVVEEVIGDEFDAIHIIEDYFNINPEIGNDDEMFKMDSSSYEIVDL